MPLPIYLAMTAAEFQKSSPQVPNPAWMACHFSPYGTGISNYPSGLPAGAMLIFNDRTPVCGHDPLLIADQLGQLVDEYKCSRVLLDLQRPGEETSAAVVNAVLSVLDCPVAVSQCYAADLSCPVFIPPVPLLQAPEDHLRAWQGREVWLELACQTATCTVTEDGCAFHSMVAPALFPHADERLCCRYAIKLGEKAVDFHIQKDTDMLKAALEHLPQVTCLVGLFQELG